MSSGRNPVFRSLTRALRTAQHHSRRDFIRTAAAAGAALFIPGRAAAEEKAAARKLSGPVVIIGGGMAGLTAALRLVQAGHEVEIYEGAPRLGGRMWTKRQFNAEGMFCELGGELVDTNHTALIALAKELGVGIQPLRDGEKGVDLYYIDGERYTDDDIIPAFAGFAKRIAADAEGLLNDKEEYTDKAKKLDAISLEQYFKDAGAGTAPWLIKALRIAYLCEYGVETDQQSALNFIDFIGTDTSKGFALFGESDEAHRIKGGNESLPEAVTAALKGKVRVFTGHELVEVAEKDSRLQFTFKHGSDTVVRGCAQAVCAIPFTVLRRVKGWDKLPLSGDKKRAIAEMTYGMNAKSMWGWNSRVWREAPIPGREVFCNGAVITSQSCQQVWETSRGQDGKAGILTNFMGGRTAKNYRRDPQSDARFLAEMAVLFPGLKDAHDGNRAVLPWPEVKWALGSYSAPGVGQYTWMYEAAAAPEMDGALIFAGEHTSLSAPGFMEGAVDSGERAAKELLG